MKNFRKVLALILVVATLFSFVAMASAKTLEDYSDAKDLNFDEAVEATKKAIEAGEATITLYGRGRIFYYRKRQGIVLNDLIN